MSFQLKVSNALKKVAGLGTSLRATQAWDPAATAATQGAEVSTTVAVPGAAIGDVVLVSHSGIVASDAVTIAGKVTAPDVVTVEITNTTAAAVNVATGTIKVIVLK